jgi:hypothetical protein
MNLDKIKKELTKPIFDHINTLDKEQLNTMKIMLNNDLHTISEGNFVFNGNIHDLIRLRNIELNYIIYLLS